MRRAVPGVHRLSRAAGAAAAAAAVLVGTVTPIGTAQGRTVILSDGTVTRWAHAQTMAAVRDAPSGEAAVMARLHYLTEDAQPEVYLVLRQQTVAGRVWIQVSVPRRPLALTGWVPRAALGPFHAVFTRIVVDLEQLRATLYLRGRPVWTSVVGVGAPATPTPKGRFYVREKLTGYSGPFYGPVALGTSSYSPLSEGPRDGVVGIHGTDAPQLLPGRVSHGCIRVPNAAVLRLARLTAVGTPILIR